MKKWGEAILLLRVVKTAWVGDSGRVSCPLFLSGEDDPFPDPRLADAEGLVAVSRDLSLVRVLEAYRLGIFPWSCHPVSWWCPDPRAVFPLDGRPLKRTLKQALQRPFRITSNRAFRKVIQACAAPGPGRESTWIEPPFIETYTRLHEEGHVHSVEVWSDGDLVGGLYGVHVGAVFCGESMFFRQRDASKAALGALLIALQTAGFAFVDSQVPNSATRSWGAESWTRTRFLAEVARHRDRPTPFPDIQHPEPNRPMPHHGD